MATSKPVPVMDNDEDDYQSKDDASTLTRAQEIQNDPDRHAKASKHLEKNAGTAQDAHKNARKHMEKKAKKGLKKAFPDSSGSVEAEKDKEMAEEQQTVHEKE